MEFTERLKALESAEEKTALMLIEFAKSGREALNADEINTVEAVFELSGYSTKAGRVDCRRIEARRLYINCITRAWPYHKKVERVVLQLAEHG